MSHPLPSRMLLLCWISESHQSIELVPAFPLCFHLSLKVKFKGLQRLVRSLERSPSSGTCLCFSVLRWISLPGFGVSAARPPWRPAHTHGRTEHSACAQSCKSWAKVMGWRTGSLFLSFVIAVLCGNPQR